MDELTIGQVNRRIAELLGWRQEVHPLPGWSHDSDRMKSAWIAPDGTRIEGHYFDTPFPDWTHDPCAALALCFKIARGHELSIWTWDVTLIPYMDGQVIARFVNQTRVPFSSGKCPTAAEALARLALAALEAEAQS